VRKYVVASFRFGSANRVNVSECLGVRRVQARANHAPSPPPAAIAIGSAAPSIMATVVVVLMTMVDKTNRVEAKRSR
jgi:hypothetical protein